MRRVKKYCFALILCASVCFRAAAAMGDNALASVGSSVPADSVKTEDFSIWYRVDSISVDENYLSNRRQIERIRHYLQNSPRVDSITIYAWASPEGRYEYNKRLSEGRARSAREFLLSLASDSAKLNPQKILISPLAENWGGLEDLVDRRYYRSDRETVLRILRDSTISDQSRKARLMRLDRGVSWRYMIDNYMPELRAASWVCVWAPAPPMLPVPAAVRDTLSVPYALGPVFRSPLPVSLPEERRTILALKTNMLYDVASLLNFSVEVPVYKDKMSVLYYHQFPWWTWGQADNEYCIRFLSIGGEARWWFAPGNTRQKRDKLTGHFLGFYGESGKYDFERRTDICRQGEFWSTGLSYGYALPVGKRLNLEFSLSAGFASIAFRGYYPSEDYEILWRDPQEVGRVSYWGITKAAVSLVIPVTAKVRRGGVR